MRLAWMAKLGILDWTTIGVLDNVKQINKLGAQQGSRDVYHI